MEEIEILDFDTKLFGFKIGKLTTTQFTREKAKQVADQCRNNGIKCLYAELDIDDYTTLDAAGKTGFVLTDVRVVLEKNISNLQDDKKTVVEGYCIDNQIGSADEQPLEQLAKEMSRVSRFAFDKKMPENANDKLYAIWVKNSVAKTQADEVFVARELKTKKPVGIITCKKKSQHGQIVLIGVNKEHTRKGIASVMLNQACCYFKNSGLNKVTVATQGKNISALGLYQKNGFFVCEVSAVFHLWS
jgi:ribosomal protein S18 acetylase RimI-like enzyme